MDGRVTPRSAERPYLTHLRSRRSVNQHLVERTSAWRHDHVRRMPECRVVQTTTSIGLAGSLVIVLVKCFEFGISFRPIPNDAQKQKRANFDHGIGVKPVPR